MSTTAVKNGPTTGVIILAFIAAFGLSAVGTYFYYGQMGMAGMQWGSVCLLHNEVVKINPGSSAKVLEIARSDARVSESTKSILTQRSCK